MNRDNDFVQLTSALQRYIELIGFEDGIDLIDNKLHSGHMYELICVANVDLLTVDFTKQEIYEY